MAMVMFLLVLRLPARHLAPPRERPQDERRAVMSDPFPGRWRDYRPVGQTSRVRTGRGRVPSVGTRRARPIRRAKN